MGRINNINKKYVGIVCIISSAFCFALMNLFVRLSGDIPSIQKSFFRNIVALIFALVIILKNKDDYKIEKGQMKYLVLRSLFGTIGILCNFYAADHLLLADASMLNKMSPFFAIIFSYLLLKEKITYFQFSAVITAFIGSLFVIKPSFVISDFLPAFIGLIGGIGAGAAYTFVRKLGSMGVKGSFIVLFFSCFSCLVTLPFVVLNYHHMTLIQVICLLLAGLSATGGQFAVTFAYCYAPAREISVYDYSQILFSAILGFFIFNQIPDGYSLLGYSIIIGSAILMYLYNVAGFFKRKSE